MLTRKKILFIVARFPYPSTDGTRKKLAEDIIASFSGDCIIDLLLIGDEKIKIDKKLYPQIHDIISFYSSRVRSLFRGMKSLYTRRPLQVEYFFRKDASRWLNHHLDNYDLVYVHTIRFGKYLEKLSLENRKKIFFDFNDAISLNYQEARKRARFPWNLVYAYEETRVRSYEMKMLALMPYVHVISDFDEKYLVSCWGNELLPAYFYKAYAGMQTHERIPFTLDTSCPAILFFGNANYPPNHDAILFFGKNIFPRIFKEIPHIIFEIAGSGSDGIPLEHAAIIKHGFVDDLPALFGKTLAVVAPIRFGAGVPTKILESLSYGVPVITTFHGIRGLIPHERWEDAGIIYVPSDDVGAWVEAIRGLLDNPTKRELLSRNALAFVHTYYAQSSVRDQYQNAFEDIINKKEKIL